MTANVRQRRSPSRAATWTFSATGSITWKKGGARRSCSFTETPRRPISGGTFCRLLQRRPAGGALPSISRASAGPAIWLTGTIRSISTTGSWRASSKLGLKDLVLVLHDWSGPLGMMYAARHRENVKAVALMETFLWDTSWKDYGKFKLVFKLFRSPIGYLMIQVMNFFVNKILPGSVVRKENMTREVMDHYRQPFPAVASRRPVRVFPQLIPVEGRPETSRLFIEEIEGSLRRLDFPVLWIKATPGAIITNNTEYRLVALAARLPRLSVMEFGPGLHYLQEDDPRKLAEMITGWIKGHSLHNLPSEIGRILLDAA